MLDHARAYDLDFAFPAGDTTVGPALRDHGEFARVILDFLIDEAASPGGVLIDVGANVGAIGLPFAARKPEWRVIAIEAHAGLAEIAAQNAATNRLANVEVIHAAAGSRSGSIDFPSPPLTEVRNFGEIGLTTRAPAVATRVVTLDEIAPPDTRLVKIDVEGFEPDVLAGAADLLASHRATWLLEAAIQTPQAAAAAIEALQMAGYDVYWFYAPFVTATARGGPSKEPALGDSNVIALPRGAANPWNLTRVISSDEPRPRSLTAYPYLRRYGYVPRERS